MKTGGVGTETQIISQEVYSDVENTKFVPVIFDTCGAKANWNMENFIADQEELIRHLENETKSLIFPKGDKYLVAIHEDSMSRAMQLEELYLNPPSRERHQAR